MKSTQGIGQGLSKLCSLDLADFQLPLPVEDWVTIQHNHFIAQQLDYDAREWAAAEACRAQMNPQQLTVHEHVLQYVQDGLEAELLKQTVAMIWDEVPMQNKYCMEAVDQSLSAECPRP